MTEGFSRRSGRALLRPDAVEDAPQACSVVVVFARPRLGGCSRGQRLHIPRREAGAVRDPGRPLPVPALPVADGGAPVAHRLGADRPAPRGIVVRKRFRIDPHAALFTIRFDLSQRGRAKPPGGFFLGSVCVIVLALSLVLSIVFVFFFILVSFLVLVFRIVRIPYGIFVFGRIRWKLFGSETTLRLKIS